MILWLLTLEYAQRWQTATILSIKTESAYAGSQSLLPWDTLKEATGDATAQCAATWLPQKSWHTTQSWSSGDRTEGLKIGDTSDDSFFVHQIQFWFQTFPKKLNVKETAFRKHLFGASASFGHTPPCRFPTEISLQRPQTCHTSLGLTAFHDGRPEHAAVLLVGNSKEQTIFWSLIPFARILTKSPRPFWRFCSNASLVWWSLNFMWVHSSIRCHGSKSASFVPGSCVAEFPAGNWSEAQFTDGIGWWKQHSCKSVRIYKFLTRLDLFCFLEGGCLTYKSD